MRTITAILLLTVVATMQWGCKKNNDNSGTLNLEVRHEFNGSPFAFGTNYTNNLGQVYQFNTANIYLSGFTAKGSTPYTFENTYLSISPDASTYTIDSIPAGDYTGLTFDIGIDSVANHSDPTTFPATSPLNPAHPRYQHWAWNTGYIFVKFEGDCDTSNTGIAGTAFFYHLGLDQLLRSVDIDQQFSVDPEGDATVTVTIDYAVILDDIDFSQELSTHTMNNLPLATKVMDETVAAFK